MLEPHCSNFRIITAIFQVSEYLGILRGYYNVGLRCYRHCFSFLCILCNLPLFSSEYSITVNLIKPWNDISYFKWALSRYLLSFQLGRVKRIWYLSHLRAATVQASLRIHAVSPEPPLLAHTSSESRGTVRQKAGSLALLNGWACAVKICHNGLLEDTNSLDGAQFIFTSIYYIYYLKKLTVKLLTF